MKRTIFSVLLLSLFITASAQEAKQQIIANHYLAGSTYYAYPGPQQKVLTPAPKGEHPFYISHYGRHGSRYLTSKEEYSEPLAVLREAEAKGKLTVKGQEVMRKLEKINAEAANRYGELTKLGAEQHKGIAKRMVQNFPEVFADSAVIEAKSTVVIRCILSMENELQQMLTMNPKLKITHDASAHDLYYMNLSDPNLNKLCKEKAVDSTFNAWKKENVNSYPLMTRLFNDTAYINKNVNMDKLNYQLFSIATILQNTELRNKISLYDIFTDSELYDDWRYENNWWYIHFGACPLTEAKMPYSQRYLLRNIIEEADSCIALPKPGATLRFGHDSMVMPLVCLMGINGYDKQIKDLNDVDLKGWRLYDVVPMASNLQFIFYRKNVKDKDVLVKVLLNEKEAKLPLKTDIAPYYHWKDVRDFYNAKLAAYKE